MKFYFENLQTKNNAEERYGYQYDAETIRFL